MQMPCLLKVFISVTVVLAAQTVQAQMYGRENNETKPTQVTKDGMTTIEINEGFSISVPEGLKVEKTGGHIKLQDPNEFFFEKLQAIEGHLERMERKQDELRGDLTILQEVVSNMGKLYNAIGQLKKNHDQFNRQLFSIKTTLEEFKENFDRVNSREVSPVHPIPNAE